MTKKEEEALQREIEQLESDEEQALQERAGEIDWMIERIADMSEKNFRLFIKTIKYQHRARMFRGEMSTNA